MNKKKFIGSSILYKRPISKTKSSFNSIAPKTTTNKQITNLNLTDDDQSSTTNVISSVRSEINKNKREIFNSNINNNKKIILII
jgi:hypothetical protein